MGNALAARVAAISTTIWVLLEAGPPGAWSWRALQPASMSGLTSPMKRSIDSMS
jgi:hypothetical protein